MCLHVYTCTTLIRRTNQHFLLTGPHFLKQHIPLGIGLGIMDKCNLILRYAVLNQCILQILIHRKVLIRSRCSNIGENQLTAYFSVTIVHLILIPYIFSHLIQLSIRIIRCILINQSCIRTKKSRLMGNLKEIINGRIYATITDSLCSYHKVFHDLLYIPVRLRLHNNRFTATKGRHIQVKHIRCLHICHFTVDIHKLRQIGKLIKSALKTEPTAFHGKL